MNTIVERNFANPIKNIYNKLYELNKRRKENMDSDEPFTNEMEEINYTKIFFTDINGRVMSLSVNYNNMDKIFENGVGFDGSSIAGYATVEQSDRLLYPIMDSFQKVRFDNEKVGFFIGEIKDEHGHRAQADPRAVLENVLKDAENEFGYRFITGPEHEFFLLSGDEFNLTDGDFGEEVHSDKAGYFHSTPHDKGEFIRNKIIEVLQECGINFEKAHHEVTPSQHEINLEPVDPIKAADRTILFTYVSQKVAVKHGYYVTFMPKPFDGLNRNALHIHLSMQDQSGKNLFYDENTDCNLSQIAKYFIGGILKYARETSIIMASTFNSYKAYIADREAPIVRGWGFRNRSSMVRVPYSISPSNTRIELRNPDPGGNIYLQLAAYIAMGLQGIREKIDCGKADIKSCYETEQNNKVWNTTFLPKSLFEALVEAEKSTFLKELLGDRLYNNFMKLKIDDWEDHRTHITPREHKKYLNI